MPRPMVVGLSPHKPAAAAGPTSGDKGGAPALMDALTDLQPHETINHKTFHKGTSLVVSGRCSGSVGVGQVPSPIDWT